MNSSAAIKAFTGRQGGAICTSSNAAAAMAWAFERAERVLVHPECRHEVVAKADEAGSTERIIKVVAASPPGSAWAIGTELNLPHLTWALEELVAGRVPSRVRVDGATRADALERMLALPG